MVRPPRSPAWGRYAKLGFAHARSVKNQLILRSQASPLCPKGLRPRILRWWGIDCATDATISWNCRFGSREVRIGSGTFLNQGVEVWSTPDAAIVIGERVALGMGTVLIAAQHEIGGPEQRTGPWHGEPITIGDGCWLAAKVLVLPGVTIGRGCVIAAGAVVASDCEPNGLYGGVPARRLRDLPV